VKGTRREGSLAGGPERHVERALETGISFHRGSVLGNLEEGSSTGDFKMWAEGGSGNGASLSMGALFREPGGDSFYGAPEGCERKALGMGVSPYGGSVGQPGVGSCTGDYEIC
jgi:hypothetical protein